MIFRKAAQLKPGMMIYYEDQAWSIGDAVYNGFVRLKINRSGKSIALDLELDDHVRIYDAYCVVES
jgi:hypothetical protein